MSSPSGRRGGHLGGLSVYTPNEHPGDVLLATTYAKSIFNFSDKVLAIWLAGLLWLLGLSLVTKVWREPLRKLCTFLGLALVLSWNFTTSALDNTNTRFEEFEYFSDGQVLSYVEAKRQGLDTDGYTTGIYSDIVGYYVPMDGYSLVSDEDYANGYPRTPNATIRTRLSDYVSEYLVEGNSVRFSDGTERKIEAVSDDAASSTRTVTFEGDEPLSASSQGSLRDVRVLDTEGNELPESLFVPYRSAFGLQGRLLEMLVSGEPHAVAHERLALFCAIMTALTLTTLCWLLHHAFNQLFATVFYGVFLLSPWVVNFAGSLLFVEFTWFVPMILGLALTMTHRRGGIIACIVGAFLAVLFKCLCSYDFISSVLVAMVAFPIARGIQAIVCHDGALLRTLVWRTLILGLAGLGAFGLAFLAHGALVGGVP